MFWDETIDRSQHTDSSFSSQQTPRGRSKESGTLPASVTFISTPTASSSLGKASLRPAQPVGGRGSPTTLIRRSCAILSSAFDLPAQPAGRRGRPTTPSPEVIRLSCAFLRRTGQLPLLCCDHRTTAGHIGSIGPSQPLRSS